MLDRLVEEALVEGAPAEAAPEPASDLLRHVGAVRTDTGLLDDAALGRFLDRLPTVPGLDGHPVAHSLADLLRHDGPPAGPGGAQRAAVLAFAADVLGREPHQLSLESIGGPGGAKGASGAPVFWVRDAAGGRVAVVKVFPDVHEFGREVAALDRLHAERFDRLAVPEVRGLGVAGPADARTGVLVSAVARGRPLDDLLAAVRDASPGQLDHAVAEARRAFRDTGAALAEMHNRPAGSGGPVADWFTERTATARIVDAISLWAADERFQRLQGFDGQRVIGRFTELLAEVRSEPGFSALVHGDPHPGNFFHDPVTGRVTVIDLESMYGSMDADGRPVGVAALDTGVFEQVLSAFAHNFDVSPLLPELRAEFLAGYLELGGQPLPEHALALYRAGGLALALDGSRKMLFGEVRPDTVPRVDLAQRAREQLAELHDILNLPRPFAEPWTDPAGGVPPEAAGRAPRASTTAAALRSIEEVLNPEGPGVRPAPDPKTGSIYAALNPDHGGTDRAAVPHGLPPHPGVEAPRADTVAPSVPLDRIPPPYTDGAPPHGTTPMLDSYRGEDRINLVAAALSPDLPPDHPLLTSRPSTWYMDALEREQYRLVVVDGRLYTTGGLLFDTRAADSLSFPEAHQAMFVVDEHGNLYAAKAHRPGMKHSSFLGGEPVAAAGMIEVHDGQIQLINGKSGHYRPAPRFVQQFVGLLRGSGADLSEARVQDSFGGPEVRVEPAEGHTGHDGAGADQAAGLPSAPEPLPPPDAVVDHPDLPVAKRFTGPIGYERAFDLSTGQAPPLFDGAPTRDQVRQGNLGDCYAVAVIGAVAGHHPDAIVSAVRESPDGTLRVRLHEALRSAGGSRVEPTGRVVELDVTQEVPAYTRTPHVSLFMDQSENGTAWAGVVEKAIAGVDQAVPPGRQRSAMASGYRRLERGGLPEDQAELLVQLTGRTAIVPALDKTLGGAPDVEAAWRLCLDEGRPVLVSFFEPPQGAQLPYRLHGGHAYEVVAIDAGGFVHLRNPWGHDHPTPVPVDKLLAVPQILDRYATLEPGSAAPHGGRGPEAGSTDTPRTIDPLESHGGPSGAGWVEPPDHVTARAYELIRAADADVHLVAANSGVSPDVIDQVKRHLFLTKHHVEFGPNDVRWTNFIPQHYVADLWMKAWNGSLSGEESIMFHRLMAHEYVESRLMEAGMPYRSSDPAAWQGDESWPSAEHHGAHDLAPLVYHKHSPFAHWAARFGLEPPAIPFAADLSNLDEVVSAVLGTLR